MSSIECACLNPYVDKKNSPIGDSEIKDGK